jgi:hypothetical protein
LVRLTAVSKTVVIGVVIEAIHHGQWSIDASLAGFDTPLSWRASWGL